MTLVWLLCLGEKCESTSHTNFGSLGCTSATDKLQLCTFLFESTWWQFLSVIIKKVIQGRQSRTLNVGETWKFISVSLSKVQITFLNFFFFTSR